MEVVKNLDGTWEKVPPQTTDEMCETCARADDREARPVRLVPRVHALPRLQDDEADLARREVPEAGLRRVHRREAVAPRQAVLRLLELGEETVRLRRVGQAHPAAVPDLQREVRPEEGEQARHHASLHGVRLEERRGRRGRRRECRRSASARRERHDRRHRRRRRDGRQRGRVAARRGGLHGRARRDEAGAMSPAHQIAAARRARVLELAAQRRSDRAGGPAQAGAAARAARS